MASKTTPALALIRFKCSIQFPYFSSLLFGLIPIEKKDDPNMKTMAVDKHMRLYYNPDLLDQISEEEAVGVLIHEINHLIRDHHNRGVTYDPQLFNIAGDMEINDDITKDANCGVKLPSWVVYPKTHNLKDDQLAEWYYNELLKKAKVVKMGQLGNQPGGGNCGSIANGTSQDGEEPFDGETGKGTPGHSNTMVDFYKKGAAEAIEEACKNRGTVPGYLQRWAKDFLKNKVDWKRELRSAIVNTITAYTTGMQEYSMKRPSRRQSIFKDFFMPGMIQPVPIVGIIQDTSGSMSDKYLSQSRAETENVLKHVKAEVIYVDVDAAVNHVGQISSTKQIKWGGGGGTDMRVGYEALAKYKKKVNVVICLTDGYTPWPDSPIPGTKNVICLISHGEPDRNSLPSWAKVVVANVEDE